MTKPFKSLKDFFIKFISVVSAGDNPSADVKLFKEKGGVSMTLKELYKELSDDQAEVIKAELKKKDDDFEDLKVAKEELKVENEKLKKNQKKTEPTEPTEEELIKSADPKIQEMLEKANKDTKEAKEKLDGLQKEKDEKDAELKKEQMEKKADEFSNLGAPKEDLVDIFIKLDGTGDKELNEKIEGIFKSTNQLLKDNNVITKVIGSDRDGEGKTAMEKMEAKVEELRKADSTLTKEKAMTKIMNEYPELYEEHLKE